MRLLHRFERASEAKTLAEALYAESIAASVRDDREGATLWVENDDELEPAKAMLEAFLDSPNDPRFKELQKRARSKRSLDEAAEKKSRHRVIKTREALKASGFGPVTLFIIIISVFVAFITSLGDSDASRAFYFVSIEIAEERNFFITKFDLLLETWKAGELWRIGSPMVLHFGLMHIGFNLWWWKDLAGALERTQSSLWLAVFVFVANLASSLPQYFFGSIRFGGLSGVVYALFGYVWIRGRFDPTFPLGLTRMTVIWMLGFYVLCFTGFMPIANWTHTGGLLLGIVWGFIGSGALRRRFMRRDR